MKVISRSEAKDAGLTRYFTGVLCVHGHIAERHVGNKSCVVCQEKAVRIRKKNRYHTDPEYKKKVHARSARRKKVRWATDTEFRERIAEHHKRYYQTHKDACDARNKEWAAENPERIRDIARKWAAKDYAANPERHRLAARESRKANLTASRKRVREWQKANPGIVNYHVTYRRALKIKATPAWANKERIKQIYMDARRLGLVVDHIIPLKSEYVCGLHVENNLQLLTAEENARKGNKFEGGQILCAYSM